MSYPSDITKEQFEIIRPILESAKKHTKPRQIDLYDIFNAVLYVVSTGCQWRALPHDYPKWKTVHYYFTVWKETKVLDEVLKKICKKRTYEQWKKTMHEHGYC